MAGKTVVVLGGGVGGVVTSNELRDRLGWEHRVILVDRERRHIFWPSLLWLQVGLRRPYRMTRELAWLEKKGIEVLQGEVEKIDPEERRIWAAGRELDADYLVISLGADLEPNRIPGLAESGHNLYSLDGAEAIRDTRKDLAGGSLLVLVAGTPFKCPAAPYEAAMLLDSDLRKRKMRQRVSVALYSPEAGPMAVAGPEMATGVRRLVEDRDIAYFPHHQVESVDSTAKEMRFTNGSQARFDFLVYVPPHVAPPVVRRAGLTGANGWIQVHRHTMETQFPRVYAIGDVTSIPLSMGLPLPKAGVFAHHQGQAVAQTIASCIAGKGHSGSFDGKGECFIEVGGGKAGFGRGNFYAEPLPAIKLYKADRHWHAGKVLFEKDWLRRWF